MFFFAVVVMARPISTQIFNAVAVNLAVEVSSMIHLLQRESKFQPLFWKDNIKNDAFIVAAMELKLPRHFSAAMELKVTTQQKPCESMSTF